MPLSKEHAPLIAVLEKIKAVEPQAIELITQRAESLQAEDAARLQRGQIQKQAETHDRLSGKTEKSFLNRIAAAFSLLPAFASMSGRAMPMIGNSSDVRVAASMNSAWEQTNNFMRQAITEYVRENNLEQKGLALTLEDKEALRPVQIFQDPEPALNV